MNTMRTAGERSRKNKRERRLKLSRRRENKGEVVPLFKKMQWLTVLGYIFYPPICFHEGNDFLISITTNSGENEGSLMFR